MLAAGLYQLCFQLTASCHLEFGGELDSTGWWKRWWRVVVGQRATLKAD